MGDGMTTLRTYTGPEGGIALRRRDHDGMMVTHQFDPARPDGGYFWGHYFRAGEEIAARVDFTERVDRLTGGAA